MKRTIATVALAALFSAGASSAGAQEFTGDVKYACEAIMCLSTGNRPSECQPSLERYFSISAKKVSDTIKKRKNFLQLCPAADDSEDMKKLVDDLAKGAQKCDAATLNQELRVGRFGIISNRLPAHCASSGSAKYVGIPGRGGRWVDAADYDRANQQHEQQQNAASWRYGNAGETTEQLR